MNSNQRVMAKVLVPSKPEENCSGCRICEVQCSMFHDHVCNPKKARIRVVSVEPGVDYPILCSHCERAECLEHCASGAIIRNDETGAIMLLSEKCTGCGDCVNACVRGAIFLHPTTGKPLICDLCDGDPQCVKYCPPKILTLVSSRSKGASASQRRSDWVKKSILPRFAKDWGLQ